MGVRDDLPKKVEECPLPEMIGNEYIFGVFIYKSCRNWGGRGVARGGRGGIERHYRQCPKKILFFGRSLLIG